MPLGDLFKRAPRKFIFVHVPKTAGTTVNTILRQARIEDDLYLSPAFAESYLTVEEQKDLDRYKIVTGHISRIDIAKFFPKRRLFTVLRDPVTRCMSWYDYIRSLPFASTDELKAAQSLPPEEFFALSPQIIHKSCNRMTHQFGGHCLDQTNRMDELFAAARKLLKKMVWIGRQERLEDDIKRLYPILGIAPGAQELPREKVVSAQIRVASAIAPGLRAKIEANNRYDIALYHWALKTLF